MKIKYIVILLFLVSASFLAFFIRFSYKKYSPKLKNPNVLFINIDSLRADHMGIYGYSKNTTPFLDSLFKKGIIFEAAYAPSYLTFQTDAAIFSSLYPSQNNVMTWNTPLKKELTLLPRILSFYGYQTAAFVSSSLWEYFGLAKQFDMYLVDKRLKNIQETKIEVAQYFKGKKKPVFVFWHVYDAHLPFLPASSEFYPNEYKGIFAGKEEKIIWEKQSSDSAFFKKRNTDKSPILSQKLKKEDIDFLLASYDSGIKYIDEQLELFFQSLAKQTDLNNTLIIISSEHGEDLKEHGFVFHRDIYDVDVRVPLVFIHPKLKAQRIKEPVSLLDIMPTISSILDITIPVNIEGQDITGLFSGKQLDKTIYIERPPFDEYAVRKGVWKYILRNPDKLKKSYKDIDPTGFSDSIIINDIVFGDELYNLMSDPYEQYNLIGNGLAVEDELKEKAEKFRVRMQKARTIGYSPRIPILPKFSYP